MHVVRQFGMLVKVQHNKEYYDGGKWVRYVYKSHGIGNFQSYISMLLGKKCFQFYMWTHLIYFTLGLKCMVKLYRLLA